MNIQIYSEERKETNIYEYEYIRPKIFEYIRMWEYSPHTASHRQEIVQPIENKKEQDQGRAREHDQWETKIWTMPAGNCQNQIDLLVVICTLKRSKFINDSALFKICVSLTLSEAGPSPLGHVII